VGEITLVDESSWKVGWAIISFLAVEEKSCSSS
jgi:hypothetical protein